MSLPIEELVTAAALATAVSIWVPAALSFVHPERAGKRVCKLMMFLKDYVYLAGAAAVASLLFPQGLVAGALSLPWSLWALSLAALSLFLLSTRDYSNIDESMIDVGAIIIAGGSVWLSASRLGFPFFGFFEPWLSLTANHFHYIGLFIMTCGAQGRLIGNRNSLIGRAYEIACPAFVVSVPLIAQGINGHPLIERAGVVLLVASVIPLITIFLCLALKDESSSRFRTLVSAACSVFAVSMALALLYNLKVWPVLNVSSMVVLHGAVNAFVVVPLLVLALRSKGSRPRSAPGDKIS